jgi:RNA polymerase sigma-70 factor, ECF subfamily
MKIPSERTALTQTLPARISFPQTHSEFQKALLALMPTLRQKGLRLTRCEAKADDLVQDTVMRALTFSAQYTFGTNLRAWVSQILFSVFVTRYRKERREFRALQRMGADPQAWTLRDPFVSPEVAKPLTGRTQEKLAQLPEGFRTVIRLVDLESQSYRDTADALQVPVGTVMSRLHRGRKMLASMMEREAA